MSATDQGADVSAADVYRGFIDAVNRQDLAEAAWFVDPARYLSVARSPAHKGTGRQFRGRAIAASMATMIHGHRSSHDAAAAS